VRRKRRAIPLSEVATVLAKSSKVALSTAEARDAVGLLCSLCPDFVKVRVVERQEYLALSSPEEGTVLSDVKDAIRRELDGK
jgi:hypothetical protein